jgi:hypothetical protein
LCNFLHSPVASSLLGPNTLLNTLFSNTLSLNVLPSLKLRNSVWCSHCNCTFCMDLRTNSVFCPIHYYLTSCNNQSGECLLRGTGSVLTWKVRFVFRKFSMLKIVQDYLWKEEFLCIRVWIWRLPNTRGATSKF